jgi:hypothetical protein
MEEFVINLDENEIERRALMAESMPDDLWAAEQAALAHRLLYSNLDERQQETHQMLIDEGVLDEDAM